MYVSTDAHVMQFLELSSESAVSKALQYLRETPIEFVLVAQFDCIVFHSNVATGTVSYFFLNLNWFSVSDANFSRYLGKGFRITFSKIFDKFVCLMWGSGSLVTYLCILRSALVNFCLYFEKCRFLSALEGSMLMMAFFQFPHRRIWWLKYWPFSLVHWWNEQG